METENLHHVEIFCQNKLTEQENHRNDAQGLVYEQQKPTESKHHGDKQVDIYQLEFCVKIL